jgi:hypothetical protein
MSESGQDIGGMTSNFFSTIGESILAHIFLHSAIGIDLLKQGKTRMLC